MHTRREVETKFKLRNTDEIESAISRLYSFGFAPHAPCWQLDYSLDTPEWLCRHYGLILRFRRITVAGHDPIVRLTLKEKRPGAVHLDNDETEFELGRPASDAERHVQTRLLAATGLQLPAAIFQPAGFVDIIRMAQAAGFTRHRILLEKQRREFSLQPEGIHATVDTLPDGIGTYLEIEAYDPVALETYIHKLGLRDYEPEPLDYGEILKRHKQSLPEVQQRTAVFDTAIRDLVIRG